MKRSTNRILTTHVGSLVKPDDLYDMTTARAEGKPYDAAAYEARLKSAIAEVVRKEAQSGIDIVNDGEFSKSSWAAYFAGRLAGVEVRPGQTWGGIHGIYGRDLPDFPAWFEGARAGGGPSASSYVLRAAAAAKGRQAVIQAAVCTGPLKYVGQEELARDIANLKAAGEGVAVEEFCMTALAPPTVTYFMRNEHYANDRDYVMAIAEAMNEEYRAIAESGIVLQLDEPFIATNWQVAPEMNLEEYRRWLEVQVEALNLALRGVPEDRVRMHVCWGSAHYPHKNDIPLEQILDLVLKVNVQAYSWEASNPRHDADWEVWKDIKLPEGKILIPGVIGHFTDFIEHPRLVAERIRKYAGVVGKENVIAGVDCGLGTRVGDESIVWAKFESMAEGARLATKELWRN